MYNLSGQFKFLDFSKISSNPKIIGKISMTWDKNDQLVMLQSPLSNGEHLFNIGQEKLVYFPTRFPTSFLQVNSCLADSWYPKIWMFLSPRSCLMKTEEWSSDKNNEWNQSLLGEASPGRGVAGVAKAGQCLEFPFPVTEGIAYRGNTGGVA